MMSQIIAFSHKYGLDKIDINTDVICHYLCSYIHWINIPISFLLYSYNPNERNIADMIGVTTLSISSYLYHTDIYHRLSEKKIDVYEVPTKDNIIYFLNDTICINLRGFLIIITNYYYNPYFSAISTTTGIIHLYSIYHSVCNILQLFIEKENETTKKNFSIIHNIITGIPIAFDVCLVSANSSREIAIPFLCVNIAMVFLFAFEPLYKLTHVGFHLLLIAQNYYICLSSSR
jgi:hypothetical protein